MNARPLAVLFLCTGNSARSILAERLLELRGEGRFRGFSAGSHPKGVVHPLATDLLRRMGQPVEGLRSKSWHEFATPGAPPLDLVITVCDNAAAETCPVWPGGPITAHWGIEDPTAAAGPEADRRRALEQAWHALDRRIRALVALPIESLDRAQLRERIEAIGRTRDGGRGLP